MTVLVTGGTGFIGGRLVRALLADGEEVRALVRPGSDARALEAAGATVVRGDVVDAGAVQAAAAACDVVYSLAVPSRVGRIAAMRPANVTGARNAALAARAAGARLVHASTTGVYGRLTALPAGEDHPTRPERPYPRTKLEGERAVADVMPDGPAVIARIASVYGPGDVRSAAMFRSALRPLTPVVGGAAQIIDMVFVDDVVAGLRACAAGGPAGRTTYNLAGGAPVPLREVLGAIAAAAGRPFRPLSLPRAPFAALDLVNRHVLLPRGIDSRVQHRFMRPPSSAAYRIDRASAELGYRPAVGLSDGLARTLAWYHDTGRIGPIPRGARA